MKNILIIIFIILGLFFFMIGSEETQENHTNTIEKPKKTYLDTPANTYKRRIEAQNIANTIQHPASYLNSRVVTRESAKKSVKESNKRMEEQNKAIEAFMK
ncbi:hypothetical protein [Sulfurovum riftiae]|uniref:Uncharacterized protein n=1 Tax=Sulfurovum riftiae TaxID=1630136 RepID=A0A151CIS9_9BACT|nr:hypothetical protein [Sulfurovum riftiae]KYJ87399.1 hypothetical protein AS592_09800 [Sulfurovum riftiae]